MELSEEHHRKMDKEAVKLEQMDKQINIYKDVKMIFSSKIYIINTKIVSQVIYLATSIFLDANTLKEIKNRIQVT